MDEELELMRGGLPAMLDRALHLLRGREGRRLRFILAGVPNTILGVVLYPVLLWSFDFFREHYMVALALNQIVCLIFAFYVQKFAVFQTRGNVLVEFPKFASYYLLNYAVNWAILPLLVQVGKFDPIIAQPAFTLVVVIGSYFWHSRITFRDAR